MLRTVSIIFEQPEHFNVVLSEHFLSREGSSQRGHAQSMILFPFPQEKAYGIIIIFAQHFLGALLGLSSLAQAIECTVRS